MTYAHCSGKIWICIFFDKPKTMQFVETRMGSRKGSLENWAIMERWLFKYACNARRMKRSIGQILLQLLEMHLR